MFSYKKAHDKKQLNRVGAGIRIHDLNVLPAGTFVVTFQKGTKGWWEHGEIVHSEGKDKNIVSVYDALYDTDTHEIYLDKYNENYRKLKKLCRRS